MTTDQAVKKRQAIEKRIMKACIAELLESSENFHLGMHDGEEVVVSRSRDARALLKAAFSTDEDRLIVYRVDETGAARNKSSGWVRFIYGNSGYDVICDYTSWLEPYIAKTEALAASIELKS